eukprot:TRINITY_DN1104_c0_g1_i1.p1 TRINITY_DN1104_c0_g1~~TRINITY_DN1104_c0_g1_i1.p1  ORF type:complete len:567 (-),score=153.47 TRINITY_DN1104_c0_g1_i1:234-1934(-)
MDATKHNFAEVFETFQKSLSESDFVSFDLEFTGLSDSNTGRDPFASASRYYSVWSQQVKKFAPTQFGVCTWKWIEEERYYEAKPFNFNIFKQQVSINSVTTCFLSQAASLTFLGENKFDFNKWVKDGISWISRSEERILLDQPYKPKRYFNDVDIDDELAEFIEPILVAIDNWLNEYPNQPLALDPYDPYHRRALYQEISKNYPNVVLETQGFGEERTIICTTTSKEMEIEKQVGFRKVLEAIVNSGKYIVGHNCMLDLLHTVGHFLADLPSQSSEFKQIMSQLFPRVVDTKFLVTKHPELRGILRETHLAGLYATLGLEQYSERPVMAYAPGYRRYQNEEMAHEAAYDAFLTGFVFIRSVSLILQGNPGSLAEIPEQIMPYVNRINLTGCDNHYYLSGEEEEVDRSSILYVTFPSHVTTGDLMREYSQYGRCRVRFLDDTSALIIFQVEKGVPFNASRVNSPKFQSIPYAEYVNATERQTGGFRRAIGSLFRSPTTKRSFQVETQVETQVEKNGRICDTWSVLFEEKKRIPRRRGGCSKVRAIASSSTSNAISKPSIDRCSSEES